MKEKTKTTTRALVWSISTAVFLAIIKFITGFLTHSMAILASALDSTMDVASSSVNLFAAIKAAKPPDEDHAYGHGKIESLASLFQSLIIGSSGFYLLIESTRRLIRGTHVDRIDVGICVMLFSILVTSILVWKLKRTALQNQSLILSTEKLHFVTDVLTNGSTIVALSLIQFTGWVFWDLLASIAVAIYIFRTSYKILRRAIDELLDRSLPPVSKDQIERIIQRYDPAIVGIHNFRSRKVGDQIFLDFHIEIRGEDDFKKAHRMTEGLIEQIQQEYPNSDVTVHYDPEGEM